MITGRAARPRHERPRRHPSATAATRWPRAASRQQRARATGANALPGVRGVIYSCNMIISRRDLPCGCDRIDTDQRDLAISDEDSHAQHEETALKHMRSEFVAGAPVATARALTWFYRHDDIRGVELVRKLSHDKLAQLVRGLRNMEPEEFMVERAAIDALLIALGLRSLPRA